MKKILFLAFTFLACITSLTGCGSSEVTSYVGTYEKYSATMGVLTGGHLINFHSDGSLEINYAFKAGVGTSMGTMNGTYITDGDTVSITYSENDEADANSYEKDLVIKGDSFRSQIFLGASMPDDGTVDGEPGITYYKVETLEYHQLSNVLIGTKIVDGTTIAYILELKNDLSFNLVAKFNEKNVIIDGTYEKVINSLDADNEIKFTYTVEGNDVVESFTYNDVYCFEFNLQHTSNEKNESVTITRLQ